MDKAVTVGNNVVASTNAPPVKSIQMHDYIQIVGVGQLGPVLGGPGAQSKLSELFMWKVHGGVEVKGTGQKPALTKFSIFIPDTNCKFVQFE